MATKKTFDFKLGDAVALKLSDERGVIIGRANYVEANPSYLVRYKSADGRLVEDWWNEEAVAVTAPASTAAAS